MTGNIRFRSSDDFREGAVFAVDKPSGWTSFDVVNKVRISLRGAYGKIKVGHAGTLDPLATGVVVVCTGKETREIERYMGQEKEYVARVTFGHTTPSYDLESAFDGEYDYSRVDGELLESVTRRFVGEIEQFPPAFSAVRVNGVRAYEMARAGDKVEMKSRRVEVRELEIVEMKMPEVVLRVTCGKGTYIRSLANDIGRECGSGSYLSALRRTRVGEFRVEQAFRVEDLVRLLENKTELNQHIN
ncbi:MAG: tRNA pseudouridine(55) synthase TruB [Odoribacteraceae bacterium]|jgi:tRNA pseudouridine55 synthase|nr:tRNA pseudouridine(55) synthase TruB [Odoribacteraceae bacterium]